ncbi:hypothetical protein F2Q69_00018125, partial [Brassica cretica]
MDMKLLIHLDQPKTTEQILLLLLLQATISFDLSLFIKFDDSHINRSTSQYTLRTRAQLSHGPGPSEAAALRRRTVVRRRRVDRTRAEAKLPEARTASSGIRSRRDRCLRLRLGERNTMMALDARDSLRLERY